LKNYSPDTVRLFILQSHYRHPIDFTTDSLNASRQAMSRLLRAVFQHSGEPKFGSNNSVSPTRKDLAKLDQMKDGVSTNFIRDFDEAMNNDLNTAQALSACFTLVDKISKESDQPQKDNWAGLLAFHLQVLGFSLEDSRRLVGPEIAKSVLDLILELRQEARSKKDYATSDLIRQKLTACGVALMDSPGGKSDWELE